MVSDITRMGEWSPETFQCVRRPCTFVEYSMVLRSTSSRSRRNRARTWPPARREFGELHGPAKSRAHETHSIMASHSQLRTMQSEGSAPSGFTLCSVAVAR